MLKIVKYELCKNFKGFIIMLIALAVAQCYYLYTFFFAEEDLSMMGSSLVMLLASLMCFFMVFGYGVFTYSKDLDSRTSYMFFMTPNPSIKIIGGKMLYTLVNGVIIGGIIVVLGIIDVKLLGVKLDEQISLFREALDLLDIIGVNWFGAVMVILGYLINYLVIYFMIITLAYLATTLLMTFLSNNKAKGFIAALLFALLLYGVIKIGSLFPILYEEPETTYQALVKYLPANIFYLVIMVFNIFACAFMLDRKVNL